MDTNEISKIIFKHEEPPQFEHALTLQDLAAFIHANARAKGFYDGPFNTAEKLMLVVSELSEALEHDRIHGGAAPIDPAVMELVKNSPAEMFPDMFKTHIKDTFSDEMADAIIRILDLCAARKIQIERHIILKMRYNATRPHKHGKLY